MSSEEKRYLLIKLLEENGELWENIQWSDLDDETIDQIFDVLKINDENERNLKIQSYLENEEKLKDSHYKNLLTLLHEAKVFKLHYEEDQQNRIDSQDIENLENSFLDEGI